MDTFRKLVEQKILDAIDNGEFDNLPGKGKPLAPDDLRGVPDDLRLEYKILKNAGLIPEELSVKKEIAALRLLLDECRDAQDSASLNRKIREKTIYYELLLERQKRKP